MGAPRGVSKGRSKKICNLPSFNKEERIMSLELRMVLHDLSELIIPVSFRNPHNLNQYSPQQRKALLQIHYQFITYLFKEKEKC